MKKFYSYFFWLSISLLGVMSACTPTSEPQPLGFYEQGVFVVNEGNFSDGNGSLSFWRPDSNIVRNQVYEAENGLTNLGGIIQHARKHQGKLYLVTNASDRILVANAFTLKEEAVISNNSLVNPFDFAAIGNQGFVSQWGATDFSSFPDGAVKVIDLNTNTISATIEVGERVMGILAFQNNIYAASATGNEVLVINPDTRSITARIPAPSATRIVADVNGKLWVLCSNATMLRINPANNSVEATFNDVPCSFFNEKMVYHNRNLYFIDGSNAVYKMSIDATSAPTEAFITAPFNVYGLGVNPANGDIYVGEARFNAIGQVQIYNSNGTSLINFTAGIGPSGFVF